MYLQVEVFLGSILMVSTTTYLPSLSHVVIFTDKLSPKSIISQTRKVNQNIVLQMRVMLVDEFVKTILHLSSK